MTIQMKNKLYYLKIKLFNRLRLNHRCAKKLALSQTLNLAPLTSQPFSLAYKNCTVPVVVMIQHCKNKVTIHSQMPDYRKHLKTFVCPVFRLWTDYHYQTSLVIKLSLYALNLVSHFFQKQIVFVLYIKNRFFVALHLRLLPGRSTAGVHAYNKVPTGLDKYARNISCKFLSKKVSQV
jgi:hypothetical protein